MDSLPVTVDLQTDQSSVDGSVFYLSDRPAFIPKPSNKLSKLGQLAGLLVAVTASPATAMSDFWFFEKRRRDEAMVSQILEGIIGRPITRTEALRISCQIIEQAERERLELAKWEAKRGIQWV